MPRVIVVHYEEDPQAQADFQLEMGDFWDDAVNFERAVFLSKLYGWPDMDAQMNRIVEGILDTSESVAVYLGDKTGADFKKLLMDRYSIVCEIVNLTVAGANRDAVVAKWVINNSALADLFANIDIKSWPRETSLSVLTDLMNNTIKQFDARRAQSWADDIEYYDQTHESAMQWANIIARGIVSYKPDAFVKWTETLVGNRRIHRAIHKVTCTGATGP